jgi:transposase
MLPQLSAAVRVFFCTTPTDMRKSFDGLFGMVREFLGQDPLSGHLFLFLNRRRDRAKILFWERDGLVIWYKNQESDRPHSFPFTEIG